MKLYFSTKQDVIACLDRCKQDWDQNVTFGNSESAVSCGNVHDTVEKVAQHHPDALRFIDDAALKQFCCYWRVTFDCLELGKPSEKKYWLLPA